MRRNCSVASPDDECECKYLLNVTSYDENGHYNFYNKLNILSFLFQTFFCITHIFRVVVRQSFASTDFDKYLVTVYQTVKILKFNEL